MSSLLLLNAFAAGVCLASAMFTHHVRTFNVAMCVLNLALVLVGVTR